MTSTRIDGAQISESLLERINTEDGVGAGLAQRTREDYARKMGIVANQIEKAGKGRLSPITLVDHLNGLLDAKKIAQSTARSLKAAAIFWLAEEAQSLLAQGLDLSEYEKAYKAIRALSTKDLPRTTQETSSTKLKFFPKQALESLIEYAHKTPQATNAGTLVAFLKANLLVGLRPAEWFNATFVNYLYRDKNGDYIRNKQGGIKTTIAMVVENAKTTHGRANGESREILLHDITDDDLAALMHMCELANGYKSKQPANTPHSDIVKGFFKPIQQTMSHALQKMGYAKKQLPTTYSTRHQAVANAKHSGLTDREIAAMFGHSSTSTAKSHYGKKVNGWMKMTFRASPESIEAVPEKTSSHDNATPTQRIMDAASEWNESVKSRSSPSQAEPR